MYIHGPLKLLHLAHVHCAGGEANETGWHKPVCTRGDLSPTGVQDNVGSRSMLVI